METTLTGINSTIEEIDRLRGILADDVISLRRDVSSGISGAEAALKNKIDAAAKLAESKRMLLELAQSHNQFDEDSFS